MLTPPTSWLTFLQSHLGAIASSNCAQDLASSKFKKSVRLRGRYVGKPDTLVKLVASH
jgi:hypothetical protein